MGTSQCLLKKSGDQKLHGTFEDAVFFPLESERTFFWSMFLSSHQKKKHEKNHSFQVATLVQLFFQFSLGGDPDQKSQQSGKGFGPSLVKSPYTGCLIGMLMSWFMKSSPYNRVGNFIPYRAPIYPKQQPGAQPLVSLLMFSTP